VSPWVAKSKQTLLLPTNRNKRYRTNLTASNTIIDDILVISHKIEILLHARALDDFRAI
jgi:hypothetical protein